MKRIVLSLAVLVLLLSCSGSMGDAAKGKGGIRVELTGGAGSRGARTVVPDIVAAADAFSMTLTSKNGFATRNAICSAGGAYVFADVEAGAWDLAITAMRNGVQLATGSAADIVVTANATATAAVELSADYAAAIGSGAFSLLLELPLLDTGIDAVTCSLENADGSPASVQPTVGALSAIDGDGYGTSLVSASGLPGGIYSLVLTMKRGAASAGVFRESVNVLGALTSDRWADYSGALRPGRRFLASDFAESDASLSGLAIAGTTPALFSFASSTTSYTIADLQGKVLTFTPFSSVDGQMIEYSWNSGPQARLASGDPSAALPMLVGANKLVITVTAPDNATMATYVVNVNGKPLYPSGEGLEMVMVPAGIEPSTRLPVNAFLLQANEVTQAQFAEVMGFNYSESPFYGASDQTGPQKPVGNVTWYDALSFCNKLSLLEGLEPVYTLGDVVYDTGLFTQAIHSATVSADFSKNGYRLPLLSERFWAARGAATTLYPWGSNSSTIDTFEWHNGNSNSEFKEVAQKLPNGYGLYDMGGNVFEWGWGSDDASLPRPRRHGSTARSPDFTQIAASASGIMSGQEGGDLGYWDNGLRVVRGVPNTRTASAGLIADFSLDVAGENSPASANAIDTGSLAGPNPNLDAEIFNASPTMDRKGYQNGAISMAGPTGSYIEITSPTNAHSFTNQQPFSVSLWFKTDAIVSGLRYLAGGPNWVPGGMGYEIRLTDGQVSAILTKNNSGWGPPVGAAPINAGEWNNVVITWNSPTLTLYVNGVPADSNDAAFPFPDANTGGGRTRLGYTAYSTVNADPCFVGAFDDFRIYDRALTPAEVAGIYIE